MNKWAFVGIGALSCAAAFVIWNQIGENLSLTPLVAGFEEKNELIVFAAEVVPVVTSKDKGWVLDGEQTAVIPARVNYTVDLSEMTENRVSWNNDTGEMTITVPPVVVQPPNVQEQKARYYRRGVWTPGEAERLMRANSIAAAQSAVAMASQPYLLRLAQDSARKAIGNTAEAYLHGAGRQDVKVTVKFDGR